MLGERLKARRHIPAFNDRDACTACIVCIHVRQSSPNNLMDTKLKI